MFNNITIIGRVGQDPTLSETTNSKVLAFSVATSEGYKKDGQWKEVTTWHRVQVWGKFAEVLKDKLIKGDLVLVNGTLRSNKAQDRNGVETTYYNIRADQVRRLNKREKQTVEETAGESNPQGDGSDPFADQAEQDGEIPF